MSESPKIAAARIEVERSRAALLETARDLAARLQPASLASEAWEKAKNKGADLAEDAVDAVVSRPVVVGGVLTALAMFLAREPLKQATAKFYGAMTPLFEPRSKAVALKEKQAAKRTRAPAKPSSSKVERRPARGSRRAAVKKTEKA